ncbi:MAG: ATP-dependent Clp protease proteolytic subunit [Acidaminococcaceae bacterium]|nr:ATP-dependent Clp protease proteolytic subunit [Acidaminococcaceae bacterium]
MNTIVRNRNGLETISIEASLRSKRILFITDEINDQAALEFTKQVFYLLHENATDPIHLFINSPGGSIDAGMLIYDVLSKTPAPVKMYCIGKAYSMAAVLFASGSHGRYILPHSKIMLHEPLIPFGIGGKTTTIQTISDSLLKTKQDMEAILALHTGRTPEEISEITKTDHYFTAQEAVDFGLADAVKDFSAMLKEGGIA